MPKSYIHPFIANFLQYDKCFPIRKTNKRYINDKPWLTAGQIEYIKTKNKRYIDRYIGKNSNEICKIHKAYRKKIDHFLRSAERKHNEHLLNDQRSNFKNLGK